MKKPLSLTDILLLSLQGAVCYGGRLPGETEVGGMS